MEDCIFCKIAKGEIKGEIIESNDNFIAFLDASPRTKGHTLVVPKKHYSTSLDLPDDLYSEMFSLAKKIAAKNIKKNKATGFNLLINNFKSAGQAVSHVHLHVIPRYDGQRIDIIE